MIKQEVSEAPSDSLKHVSPDFAPPSPPQLHSGADAADGCATPPQGFPKVPPTYGTTAVAVSTSHKRKAPATVAVTLVKTEPEQKTATQQATQQASSETTPTTAAAKAAATAPVSCMGYDAKTIEENRATRLRRNREAAQQFRKRKKEYVNIIEQEADRLRRENVALRARLDAAETENRVLRDENTFYKGLVNGRAATAAAPSAGAHGAVSSSTVGPRSKVAKVAAGAMCAMMMVVGCVYTTQPLQAAGGGGLVPREGGGHNALGAAAMRRRMTSTGGANWSEAVPLPGELWPLAFNGSGHAQLAGLNASALASANASDAASDGTVKWLSLIQPYQAEQPDYLKRQRAVGDHLQSSSYLHRGFLTRDAITGDLAMNWDMLARFGALSNPATRYIFCPDAQQVGAGGAGGGSAATAEAAAAAAAAAAEGQMEVVKLTDSEDHDAHDEIASPAASTTLVKVSDQEVWQSPATSWDTGTSSAQRRRQAPRQLGLPVPARRPPATTHSDVQPPDFEPEELEWTNDPTSDSRHRHHRGGVGGGEEEFGVSLLIPTGDGSNETFLGGGSVPSMQFLELRCSVANVTHRTFTI